MIEIKNFTKCYVKGKPAVDDLTLTINNKDIFAFIGHNGAGKTTLIKAICGIIDFDNGDILLDGKSIKAEPDFFKRAIAYVPDNPDIYNFMTGAQFINFICDVYKIPKDTRQAEVDKYAKLFGIDKNLSQKVSEYSHGMKQKLVLISAFVRKPKVLILDEPFVGLDPIASHLLKELMKDFCKNGGLIFFSTHVLEVAEKLCNRVGIIKNGKLIKCGSMKDIKGDSSLEDIFLELENE